MGVNRTGNPRILRIGAQVITWGDQVRTALPHILAHLRSCGYRGVEIGMRHFDLDRAPEYLDLFKRHDITLVAAHSGGTFWNKAQADQEMNTIEHAIRFAASLNAVFFALSGNNRETPETMKVTAESYNRIGRLCRNAGLQLAYHNHDWEFAVNGALFNTLLAETDPALVRLLPDVAWLHRAGLAPSDFLRKHGDRVAFVHLKDTLPDRFCELGRGNVDLNGILACLPELELEWCVVEQDSTDSTPENSLSISAACLREKRAHPMTDTLNALIVGSGDMGATHARGYAALEDIRIVAVADPDETRTAALAAEHSIDKAYADYHEAIQQEKPDIVSVCVPAFLHCEVALYAMEQGCRVLCEKPIALTLEAAERMVVAEEKMPGRLGIVFQRRYLPVWLEVQKRLPVLGKPLSYQAADFRPIRPKRLMHSRSGNGGPVIDCCVHDFDMAMRLFGPVRSVHAMGGILAQGKPELKDIQDLAVDTATISLQFDNGHTALVSYCWGLPTGFKDVIRIEILGPEGMLRIGDSWVEHHMGCGRVETVTGLHTNGHAAQIAAFISALRNNDPLPIAPREAIQALHISHRALAAIEKDISKSCCCSENSQP